MTPDSLIALSSWRFWAFVVLAIGVVTPVKHPGARQVALALVNAAFLALVLQEEVLYLFAGLVGAFLLLRVVGKVHRRLWLALFIVAGSLALFVLHKVPNLSEQIGTGGMNPILVTIGFSYVFLRFLELLRAVTEGVHPPPGPLQFLNFLLPFHMLAAGPIQAYDEFLEQDPVPPALTPRRALEGFERIARGLFKKFVLAFLLMRLFSTGWQSEGWYFWVEVQIHFIWLFLDFSAYSDIAIGIGILMGVRTPENFNRPYLARNITIFWERWHISLSMWIRRNLFLPIQLFLMRKTRAKSPIGPAAVAIFTAFLLCGLWHGVSMDFFFWGMMHGAGLMVAILFRAFLQKKLGAKGMRKYMANWPIRIVSTVITFEFVAFSVMLVGHQWKSPW